MAQEQSGFGVAEYHPMLFPLEEVTRFTDNIKKNYQDTLKSIEDSNAVLANIMPGYATTELWKKSNDKYTKEISDITDYFQQNRDTMGTQKKMFDLRQKMANDVGIKTILYDFKYRNPEHDQLSKSPTYATDILQGEDDNKSIMQIDEGNFSNYKLVAKTPDYDRLVNEDLAIVKPHVYSTLSKLPQIFTLPNDQRSEALKGLDPIVVEYYNNGMTAQQITKALLERSKESTQWKLFNPMSEHGVHFDLDSQREFRRSFGRQPSQDELELYKRSRFNTLWNTHYEKYLYDATNESDDFKVMSVGSGSNGKKTEDPPIGEGYGN